MIAYNPYFGDIEDFIEKNKGMVYQVAIRCSRKTKLQVELEDLLQEGYIGLIKTYVVYDSSKGTLSTLAYSLIRNEIMRYIRDCLPIIRPPKRLYELTGKVIKNRMNEATPEDIAERFGESIDASERALKMVHQTLAISFNEKVPNTAGKRLELWELFEFEDDLSKVEVNEFMKKLTVQQLRVIESLMEFNTKAETAREIGVSRTRVGAIVRQIEERYLKDRRRWI